MGYLMASCSGTPGNFCLIQTEMYFGQHVSRHVAIHCSVLALRNHFKRPLLPTLDCDVCYLCHVISIQITIAYCRILSRLEHHHLRDIISNVIQRQNIKKVPALGQAPCSIYLSWFRVVVFKDANQNLQFLDERNIVLSLTYLHDRKFLMVLQTPALNQLNQSCLQTTQHVHYCTTKYTASHKCLQQNNTLLTTIFE